MLQTMKKSPLDSNNNNNNDNNNYNNNKYTSLK